MTASSLILLAVMASLITLIVWANHYGADQ